MVQKRALHLGIGQQEIAQQYRIASLVGFLLQDVVDDAERSACVCSAEVRSRNASDKLR
jgi:hypothetical protein